MWSKVAEKSPKPQPAKGQVWMYCATDCERVIVDVSTASVYFADGAHAWLGDLNNMPYWQCVGIETPAGRVMIGERRQTPRGNPATVIAIDDGARVFTEEGDWKARWSADQVARWPLVPSDAAPLVTPSDVRAAVESCRSGDDGASVAALAGAYYESIGRAHAAKPIGTTRGTLTGSASIDWAWAPGKTADESTGMVRAVAQHAADIYLDALRESERIICQTLIGTSATTAMVANDREKRRSAIDAILAEDARKHPAFATAKRAAVMAAFEGAPPVAPDGAIPVTHAIEILRDCHRYEACRGGMSKPSAKAVEWAAFTREPIAFAAYERVRGSAVSRVAAPAIDHAARAKAIRAMDPEQSIAEAYGAK